MKTFIEARAEELVPGAGFFAGTDDFGLIVPIGAEVDELVLETAWDEPTSMNIASIIFVGENGKELDRNEIVHSATMTTTFSDISDDEIAASVRQGRMLHSKRELSPQLIIKLRTGTHVAHVDIRNRNGEYGRRSLTLRVKAFCANGGVIEHDNADPAHRTAVLKNLIDKLGVDENVLERLGPDEANRLIRSLILSRLDAGMITMTPREIAPFLRLNHDVNSPNEFELTLASHIAQSFLGKAKKFSTNRLSPIQNILRSPAAINDVIGRVNDFRLRAGHDSPLFAAKHMVTEEVLHPNKDRYLLAMQRFFDVCGKLGVEACLCYGTLLGAVREGRFLRHDDDVDLLYFDGSTSLAEARQKKKVFMDQLRAEGISVWQEKHDQNENFHINVDGINLDIFPSWVEGEDLHLMMQGLKYRPIKKNIVLPMGIADIYGHTFPAPNNPTEFLVERYGQTWGVSDPYHEWPWRLIKPQPPELPRNHDLTPAQSIAAEPTMKRVARKFARRLPEPVKVQLRKWFA